MAHVDDDLQLGITSNAVQILKRSLSVPNTVSKMTGFAEQLTNKRGAQWVWITTREDVQRDVPSHIVLEKDHMLIVQKRALLWHVSQSKQ